MSPAAPSGSSPAATSAASASRRKANELVYAKAGTEKYPPLSDVYRVSSGGGKSTRLTKDHNSQDPLWGPNGKIVFVKLLGAKQRKYGPKNELYLMSDDGTGVKRLTHTKVDPLLQGLYPTAVVARTASACWPSSRARTPATRSRSTRRPAPSALDRSDQGERGFVGAAISSDGTTVLGSTGGFEPGPGHDVATMPYAGGKAKVLVKNAFSPDWSR